MYLWLQDFHERSILNTRDRTEESSPHFSPGLPDAADSRPNCHSQSCSRWISQDMSLICRTCCYCLPVKEIPARVQAWGSRRYLWSRRTWSFSGYKWCRGGSSAGGPHSTQPAGMRNNPDLESANELLHYLKESPLISSTHVSYCPLINTSYRVPAGEENRSLKEKCTCGNGQQAQSPFSVLQHVLPSAQATESLQGMEWTERSAEQ